MHRRIETFSLELLLAMGRPFLTLLPAGEWQALSEYVQKVLNLRHAWEFVLDRDVLVCSSDFAVLSHVARLVNEGFFEDGGRVRGVPVAIGGGRSTSRRCRRRRS